MPVQVAPGSTRRVEPCPELAPGCNLAGQPFAGAFARPVTNPRHGEIAQVILQGFDRRTQLYESFHRDMQAEFAARFIREVPPASSRPPLFDCNLEADPA